MWLSCLLVGALGSAVSGATGNEPVQSSGPGPVGAVGAKLSPGGKTLIVEISGDIDLGLSAFVERVLGDVGPGDLVVFHVNTFGGRIDAAVSIRDAILAAKAHTVAFIDKRAISAGALISLATDEIVMTHGATIGAATPIELKGGQMAPVEAKVVSYFRKEMKATAEAKGRRGDVAEAMVDAAVEVKEVGDGKDTTLTLTTEEALRLKIAVFSVDTLDALLGRFGRPQAGSPATLRPRLSWAERVARFLSEPAISSLLMTLGMLGIMIELWAPGHALAGTLGVVCLLLFFFGQYVVHLAGWGEILLFVLGAAAVGFEVLFWPGHGALAVLGVLLILGSLIGALLDVRHVPFEVSWSLGWVTRALVRVFGSVLATGAAMLVVARLAPSTRFGRALVLDRAITEQAGSAQAQARVATGGVGDALVGRSGTTETALRPAGKALVSGRRIDVVTEGDFIEPGTPVVVVALDGSRIVVRRKSA